MRVITVEEFELRKILGDIYGSVSTIFEKDNKGKKGLWHHYFSTKTKKMMGIVVYENSEENIEQCVREAEKSNKIFNDIKNYKKEKAKSEAELKKEILNSQSIEEIHSLLKGTDKECYIGNSSIKTGKWGNYVDFGNFYGNKKIVMNF